MKKTTWFDVIGYKPHPKQWLYHNSEARFKAPICGRRFGKSIMSGKDAEPKLLKPKQRIWIVGPTYDLAEKEFRVIWEDMIINKQLGLDRRVRKAYNKQQGNMYIEFPWQTRLEVRTADRPENLVGESLNHVIMSEAAKHKKETWERYIRPALADQRGTADFPSTPEGQNWLYDIWRFGQDPAFDDYDSWQFPSWENEAIYPGGIDDPEIELLRLTMDADEFAQEIGADFTSFTGKVYPDFKESTHVKSVKYNPNLPNYIGFDFGYIDPTVAIEFQITPSDEVLIWREHYMNNLTIRQHIDLLKSRENPPGYQMPLAFGDSADPAAVQDINMHYAPCIALPEAKTNWREGIDLVNSFVRLRASTQVIDEYGTPAPDKPGLYVDFSCINTIREFNNYKAKNTVGKRINSPTDIPQKVNDHAMDAIRYALMHIYRVGIAGSLEDTMPTLQQSTFLRDSDTLNSIDELDTFENPSPLWAGSGDREMAFFSGIEDMEF